jgi:hypothetical protein
MKSFNYTSLGYVAESRRPGAAKLHDIAWRIWADIH